MRLLTALLRISVLITLMISSIQARERSSTQKVILIDIRGASKAFIDSLLDSSTLKGDSAFSFLEKNSHTKSAVEPVPNAVTALNSATLDTGVYANSHGIVGNVFGIQKNGKFQTAGWFNLPFLTETIWEKAARKGKKVIRLGSLNVTGSGGNHSGIKTLPQVSALSESKVVDLTARDCPYKMTKTKPEKFVCLTSKFATSADLNMIFGEHSKKLVVVAVDEEFDGRRAFRKIIVDDDHNEANGYIAKIATGDWFRLTIKQMYPADIGVYAKLVAFSPDLEATKIYFAPSFQNKGSPKSFIAEIEKKFRFAPGGPDFRGFVQGKIDIETVMEQAHRETDYMKNAALNSIENLDFDLLILDHPLLDRYGHYLYSSSNQRKNLPLVKNGYLATDKNLGDVLSSIDKRNTSLLVISGHGFSYTHTSFSISKLFESLAVKISPAEDAEIAIFSSKVSAHIYLNNRDLKSTEKAKYLKTLKRKLLNYKDPNSGKPIFAEALLASEMKTYHLNSSKRSGDLWVSLNPGFTFDGVIDKDKLIGKPFFPGEHGYFDKSLEAKGVFFSYGPKRIKLQNKTVTAVDIAAMISDLLGVK